jgi:hypothetical protein
LQQSVGFPRCSADRKRLLKKVAYLVCSVSTASTCSRFYAAAAESFDIADSMGREMEQHCFASWL